MTARPCITCGVPTPMGTHCPGCTPARTHTLSASRRGYGAAWQRLSKRARRAQPFCSDCGGTADLTTDHSTQAWHRYAAGLPVRLADVAVVCRSCNGKRGKAKPNETASKDDNDTPSRVLDTPPDRGGIGLAGSPKDRWERRSPGYSLRGAAG